MIGTALRVAYVCCDPGVPVFGRKGCSIHVQEVLRAMCRTGIQVELFATRFDGERPADLSAVMVHALPPAPKGDLARREQLCLAGNNAVQAALRAEGPFDLVYERYSLWSFSAMEYAQQSGTPTVLEVNAPLIEEQARHRGLVDRAAAEQVMHRAFGCAGRIICVSQKVADYARQAAGANREAQSKVHVVSNGVDPKRFPPLTPATCPASDPDTFTVGFVGTLKPWHGTSLLIEAFAAMSAPGPRRLLIVGDGPERENLLSLAARRGLQEQVHFAGGVDPSAIPGYLASMDAAAAPYTGGGYFSPLKVYEYMAASLPVVASRIGDLTGLIDDGRNGFLVEAGNVSALGVVLDRLRADPVLRRTLGAAARSTVLRDHTWDHVVRRIFRLAGVHADGAVEEQVASELS